MNWIARLIAAILGLFGRTQQREAAAEAAAVIIARERKAAEQPVDSAKDLGKDF